MKGNAPEQVPSTRRIRGKHIIVGIGLSVLVAVFVTVWWVNHYVFAGMFVPIRLNETEQEVLQGKIAPLLRGENPAAPTPQFVQPVTGTQLEPEPYIERKADRKIQLTEREVNALLATDPEMARHMAVDLADGLISVKLVVPVKNEMPLVGGKMVKLTFGVALRYADGKPVVAMRGISVGGIPLPAAWWGDIKNINLIEELGGSGGLWDKLAKGVEDVKIQEGQLSIQLKG